MFDVHISNKTQVNCTANNKKKKKNVDNNSFTRYKKSCKKNNCIYTKYLWLGNKNSN